MILEERALLLGKSSKLTLWSARKAGEKVVVLQNQDKIRLWSFLGEQEFVRLTFAG